ncbi:hypothetical protein JAAARDRAFT_28120 [Jaapia argillacea MUCL 33604]|uniref:C2H2-type domain-containing protein n=1 Tax=Jaapia argillacea MUCL 33604 TaxID=933084 RepID=A0A067QEB1_9AGAM|nr:hypothetical protein JAAARDRAFT_28120 [Jaapia argillacea MUCL 33604]
MRTHQFCERSHTGDGLHIERSRLNSAIFAMRHTTGAPYADSCDRLDVPPNDTQGNSSTRTPLPRPERGTVRSDYDSRHTYSSTGNISSGSSGNALNHAREETLARTLESSRRMAPRNRIYHSLPLDQHTRVPPYGTASTSRSQPNAAPSRYVDSRTPPHPLPTPPNLSVFNSPTATYMWPGFQAASQMTQRPVIYVNYKGSVRPNSEVYSQATASRDLAADDSLNSQSVPRKRRPSTDIPNISHPAPVRGIIEPFKKIHISQQSGSRPVSRTYVPRHSGDPPYPQPPSGPRVDFHEMEESSGEEEVGSYFPPQPPHPGLRPGLPPDSDEGSSEDGENTSQGTPSAPDDTPQYGPDEWLQYAQAEGAQHRCTWPTIKDDVHTPCGYLSRKHLVKRHIQTTHMKIKRWKCEFCGKAFPQKGSLDNHKHTHTGAKPHECRFGCGESFNDPARRHRHMIERHGYIPKRNQKNLGVSEMEPVLPMRLPLVELPSLQTAHKTSETV